MCGNLKDRTLALIPRLRAFAFCLVQDLKEADNLVCASIADVWPNLLEGRYADLQVTLFSAVHRQLLWQESVGLISFATCGKRPILPAHDSFPSRFARLPRNERVAVSLLNAWGFSLDEAAQICACDRETILRRAKTACRSLCEGAFAPSVCNVTKSKAARKRASASSSRSQKLSDRQIRKRNYAYSHAE